MKRYLIALALFACDNASKPADAPASGAPKSAASEAAKSDAPKSDAPKSDAPQSDAPKADPNDTKSPELTPEEEAKVLNALGRAIAGQVKGFSLSEAEVAQVVAGLEDGVLGRPAQIDVKEFQPKIGELARARMSQAAEKEKVAGKAYLDQAAQKPGAKRTESGLIYIETLAGAGAQPTAANTVKVHYHGTLTSGEVFDSSVERGQPAEFPLGGVVKCWQEGVAMMKAGGKATLVCPSDLAYGDRGSPPKIGPGATLVFDVELIEVK